MSKLPATERAASISLSWLGNHPRLQLPSATTTTICRIRKDKAAKLWPWSKAGTEQKRRAQRPVLWVQWRNLRQRNLETEGALWKVSFQVWSRSAIFAFFDATRAYFVQDPHSTLKCAFWPHAPLFKKFWRRGGRMQLLKNVKDLAVVSRKCYRTNSWPFGHHQRCEKFQSYLAVNSATFPGKHCIFGYTPFVNTLPELWFFWCQEQIHTLFWSVKHHPKTPTKPQFHTPSSTLIALAKSFISAVLPFPLNIEFWFTRNSSTTTKAPCSSVREFDL